MIRVPKDMKLDGVQTIRLVPKKQHRKRYRIEYTATLYGPDVGWGFVVHRVAGGVCAAGDDLDLLSARAEAKAAVERMVKFGSKPKKDQPKKGRKS